MARIEEHSDFPVEIKRARPSWLQALIAVPAAVFPVLPSFSCPVCIAAYAGILSSLGLGFVLTDRVQRPLIVLFLTIALTSVAWATSQHKKLGPLMLVLPGSLVIVIARLVWSIPWVLYVGVSCLVAGAVWNLILKRTRPPFVQLGLDSTQQSIVRLDQ